MAAQTREEKDCQERTEMTIETKTTIQPSDITTVEFECAECHSMISWPLAVAKNPPLKCHCSDQPWLVVGNDTHKAIVDLIALLQRFSKAEFKTFHLRLGLKDEVSLAHVSGSKV
jgi:hypothetical protein